MELAVALPPRWRRDLGSLAMLAVLWSVSRQHPMTLIVPAGERLSPSELLRTGASAQKDWGAFAREDVAARVLVVPASSASVSWAVTLLRETQQAAVLFVADLCTTPRLSPDLIALADGALLCEPHWHDLLRAAEPELPLLLLDTAHQQDAPGLSPSGSGATVIPYIVTWSPATEPSIALITEAFGLLVERAPQLQLVVLGDGGTRTWRRWTRMMGVALKCWLPGADAFQRADALMANAVATISPIAPHGLSAAPWWLQARASSPPHVALTAGEAGWVSVVNGVPQVQAEAHGAARTLALTIEMLLEMDADAAGALARLRRKSSEQASREQLSLLPAFLDAVQARRAQGNRMPGHTFRGDCESYFVGLSTNALGGLGLPELAPQTVHAIACSIAGLTR
jgi:hypothetical protein